jgi:tetratricopeptide (TPR) repeat protein
MKEPPPQEIEELLRELELEYGPHATEARQHLDRADALEEHEDYAKALEECDAAIQLDANLADAYNLRGLILEGLGRKNEAVLASREALRLHPGLDPAVGNLQALESETTRGPFAFSFVLALVLNAGVIFLTDEGYTGVRFGWDPVVRPERVFFLLVSAVVLAIGAWAGAEKAKADGRSPWEGATLGVWIALVPAATLSVLSVLSALLHGATRGMLGIDASDAGALALFCGLVVTGLLVFFYLDNALIYLGARFLGGTGRFVSRFTWCRYLWFLWRWQKGW